jgi:hypothetical protein
MLAYITWEINLQSVSKLYRDNYMPISLLRHSYAFAGTTVSIQHSCKERALHYMVMTNRKQKQYRTVAKSWLVI